MDGSQVSHALEKAQDGSIYMSLVDMVIMKKHFVMGGFTAWMSSWFSGKIHTVDPCTMRRTICRCSSPYIKWYRIKNTVCPQHLEISNHRWKIHFDPCLVESSDAKPRICRADLMFIENNLYEWTHTIQNVFVQDSVVKVYQNFHFKYVQHIVSIVT